MKKDYLELFKIFFKIGGLTFGGGYAMIPIIEREIIDNKKWIDEEMMLDIIAIAESTPGVLAVNCATFTGYKVAGVLGSLMATLGVIIPSFLIIVLISLIFPLIIKNQYVSYVFDGIKAGIVVLIFEAGIKLSKSVEKNVFNIILFLFALSVALFTEINVIYVLLVCAIIGICFTVFNVKNLKEEEK